MTDGLVRGEVAKHPFRGLQESNLTLIHCYQSMLVGLREEYGHSALFNVRSNFDVVESASRGDIVSLIHRYIRASRLGDFFDFQNLAIIFNGMKGFSSLMLDPNLDNEKLTSEDTMPKVPDFSP